MSLGEFPQDPLIAPPMCINTVSCKDRIGSYSPIDTGKVQIGTGNTVKTKGNILKLGEIFFQIKAYSTFGLFSQRKTPSLCEPMVSIPGAVSTSPVNRLRSES
jgi:hypothetical protein